jgi:magnesium-protoporphyrin IX monomethyl ester (oxidative) cyclase
MHEAMGLDADGYDYAVFRVTSEISRQVFPLTLDIDHPAFRAGLKRLCRIAAAAERAKAQGGMVGAIKRGALAAAGAAAFARLYLLPVKRHALPRQVRVAPAW